MKQSIGEHQHHISFDPALEEMLKCEYSAETRK